MTACRIGFRTVRVGAHEDRPAAQELDLAEISLVSPAGPGIRPGHLRQVQQRRPAVASLRRNLPCLWNCPRLTTTALRLRPPSCRPRCSSGSKRSRPRPLRTLDEVAARLDKIETRLARPSARVEVREDQAQLETKAFLSFCRKGCDGLSDLERKVLTAGGVGSPSDGGGWQLVPETFLRELMRNLVEISPMRSIARVQTGRRHARPAAEADRQLDRRLGCRDRRARRSASRPTPSRRSPIFEARVSTEVTNQLLEDSAFDLAAELARDFAEEFARLEGAAFVSGNGTTQPEGFLTSFDFTTVAGGAALDADDVIDLFHSIPSFTPAKGTWVMRRETIGNIRKLKATGTGNYLWTESLQPGNPPSILGRPVVEMPDLATVGSPADTAIAFGDWNQRVSDLRPGRSGGPPGPVHQGQATRSSPSTPDAGRRRAGRWPRRSRVCRSAADATSRSQRWCALGAERRIRPEPSVRSEGSAPRRHRSAAARATAVALRCALGSRASSLPAGASQLCCLRRRHRGTPCTPHRGDRRVLGSSSWVALCQPTIARPRCVS